MVVFNESNLSSHSADNKSDVVNKQPKEQECDKEEEEEYGEPGEDEYEVEKVIKKRIVNGQLMWYVKWLDYEAKYNTWEPFDNLVDVVQFSEFEEDFARLRKDNKKYRGFDKALPVAEIRGAKMDQGKLMFLVKWSDQLPDEALGGAKSLKFNDIDETPEFVSAEDCEMCCSKALIEFYEKYLIWTKFELPVPPPPKTQPPLI